MGAPGSFIWLLISPEPPTIPEHENQAGANMPNLNPSITALVESFVHHVVAAAEAAAAERARLALAGAFGTPTKGGPGKPKTSRA